jgi:hypothetical protein
MVTTRRLTDKRQKVPEFALRQKAHTEIVSFNPLAYKKDCSLIHLLVRLVHLIQNCNFYFNFRTAMCLRNKK